MRIWETTQKIEILTNWYKLYIAVYIMLASVFMCLLVSEYVLYSFNQDTYNYSRGDQPLEFYRIEYKGAEVTTVVTAWVDQEGNIHHAKETPRLFGISVPFLVLLLSNLGVVKAGYDIHRIMANRYRKRLLAKHFPKSFIKSLNL